MKLFLTSNIGGYKKENGDKIPSNLFENNDFLNNLKKHLNGTRKFVLIASDPSDYERNELFLQIDIESLKLSDLKFEEYLLLDGRNKENITDILEDSDLIFLSGGDTYKQNIFFNDINLKEYLKNTHAVIVGISAGSINSAYNAYNSPECEEDLKYPSCFKGLGLTTINIEPHFVLDDLCDDNKKIQREEILKESFNRTIIALTDGAYILKNDTECNLYGESYTIKDGIITKICDNNEYIVLNDNY